MQSLNLKLSLHEAAQLPDEAVAFKTVKLLLAKGANPNLQNAEGRTALHVAAEMNRADVLEELVASGGCPLLHDLSCFSPIDAAAATGSTQALTLLHSLLLSEEDEEDTKEPATLTFWRRGAVVVNNKCCSSSDGTFYSCSSNVADWVLKCARSEVSRSSSGLSAVVHGSIPNLPSIPTEDKLNDDERDTGMSTEDTISLTDDSETTEDVNFLCGDSSHDCVRNSIISSVMSSASHVHVKDILNTAFLKPDNFISFLSYIDNEAQFKNSRDEDCLVCSVSKLGKNGNDIVFVEGLPTDATDMEEKSVFRAQEIGKERFCVKPETRKKDQIYQSEADKKTYAYDSNKHCKHRVDDTCLCDSDDTGNNLRDNTGINLSISKNCDDIYFAFSKSQKQKYQWGFLTAGLNKVFEEDAVTQIFPATFPTKLKEHGDSRSLIITTDKYKSVTARSETKKYQEATKKSKKVKASENKDAFDSVPVAFDILATININSVPTYDFTAKKISAEAFRENCNDTSIPTSRMKTPNKNTKLDIFRDEKTIRAGKQLGAPVLNNEERSVADAVTSAFRDNFEKAPLDDVNFVNSHASEKRTTSKGICDYKTDFKETKRTTGFSSNYIVPFIDADEEGESNKIKVINETSVATRSSCSKVSLVEEYIYKDKSSDVTLIERRSPTLSCKSGCQCSCSNFSQSQSSSRVRVAQVERSRNTTALTSVPSSIAELSTEALRQQLSSAASPLLGPITDSTHRTYGRLLHRLRNGKKSQLEYQGEPAKPQYPRELQQALSRPQLVPWDRYVELEQIMVRAFARPRLVDYWRGGTSRVCFNYLLLDPSVTCGLPLRVNLLSSVELFRIFISSIFYVGKGTKSRPYSHLYEALKLYKAMQQEQECSAEKYSPQAKRVATLWKEGHGVVSLHIYHHTISAEAHTREAAIIDAIGVPRLCNKVRGTYYGPAHSFTPHERRCLGVLLLHRALVLLLCEGERLIRPPDLPPNPWTSKF